jgi:hypothetical protein
MAKMPHAACNTHHANDFSGRSSLIILSYYTHWYTRYYMHYYTHYHTHYYTHYFIMSSMRCLNSGLFIRLLAICESVVPRSCQLHTL